jgi:hypothetical protein
MCKPLATASGSSSREEKTSFSLIPPPFSAVLTIDQTLKCQTSFGLFF